MPVAGPFASFFMAGFEAATHRRRDGVRLDLLRATAHDRHALADYRRCREAGLATIRDALRWHRIEARPGHYDWTSWRSMLEAAETAGVEVIWTLHHYGTPDHLDPRSGAFVDAFADFAAAAIRLHREVTGRPAIVCPINEISFFAWAVGKRYFPIGGVATAGAIKRQLVRAGLAAVDAMRAEDPQVRFCWSEPLIHVAPRDESRQEWERAEAYRRAQFEVYDMLTGRSEPQLGGHEGAADHLGLNFYPHNQWYFEGGTIPLGHHAYRPLAEMLAEMGARYRQPLLIAETGAEGPARAAWLHYVCDEARRAIADGCRIDGICLYPVTHYPGWDNSRAAETGLFSEVDRNGERQVYRTLMDELDRQRALGGFERPRESGAVEAGQATPHLVAARR